MTNLGPADRETPTKPNTLSRLDRRFFAAQWAFGLLAAVELVQHLAGALQDRDAWSIVFAAAWALVVGAYLTAALAARQARPSPSEDT